MSSLSRHLWLIVFALMLAPPTARAGSDLDDALKALAGERDPAARLKLIKRLAANDGVRAAGALERLVRADPEVRVRVAAAHALGRSRAPKVDERIAGLVLFGGPLGVRRAVSAVLRRHPAAVEKLRERLQARRIEPLEATLILRAFGSLKDDATLTVLMQVAGTEDCSFCSSAIRSLAARTDNRAKRLTLLGRLLHRSRDPETVLSVLDAAAPVADAMMKPAALRLATSLEPRVRAAAQHLLRRIAQVKAAAAAKPPAAKKGPEDRYAKPDAPPPGETVPPEPSLRDRYDLVYLLDATGSAHMNLPRLRRRIEREVEQIMELGASVRVGIVAYRGRRSPKTARDVLPLTFDTRKIRTYLRALKTGGVDDRGAAIGEALHDALDRMDWRATAKRRVKLFADTGAHEPRRALAKVSIHFRADRTRTSVAYILRTRTVVPPELAALARAGGTGTVELLP